MKFKKPVRCKRCRELLNQDDIDLGSKYCEDCRLLVDEEVEEMGLVY